MAGRATILVVDDDPGVRQFASLALAGSGYHVITAEDGAQALALLDGSIDLVLTDVVMPGMDGIALANAIQELRPRVPVILMSGWSSGVEQVRHHSALPFLAKPFGLKDLLGLVSKFLQDLL